MTHSKHLVLLLITMLAGCIFASPPDIVFKNNRERILSGDCKCVDGYCFGVGEAVSISETSQSVKAAVDKSILQASVNVLVGKALGTIKWPATIGVANRRVLRECLARYMVFRNRVSGIQTVSTDELPENRFVSVVSVPEIHIRKFECSIDEVEKILLDPNWLKGNFKKHPDALYEFCVARRALPDELCGTDFHNWDSNQINLFCGLPITGLQNEAVIVATNVATTCEEKDVRKQSSSKKGIQEVQSNENETIGF